MPRSDVPGHSCQQHFPATVSARRPKGIYESVYPQVSRDPKDDKFLATAVASEADYVVSEDRDLLDLGAHIPHPLLRF